MSGKEWAFIGDVTGKGMYDDNGEKSGFVIEDFDIEFIQLQRGEEIIVVRNLAVMPDQFSQREIRYVEKEAEEKFLEDWMDVQECAHDLLNEAN